jgi:hypothetical protein
MKKYLSIIILLLFLISGCDLLTTRTPEDPESRRSTFVTPVSAEILFQNLTGAFREKIVENYIACFVDTAFADVKFVFQPSAGASIPGNWNLQNEKDYFNSMLSSISEGSQITLQLVNETKNILENNKATYQYDYSISLPNTDTTLPEEFEGSAQFTIIKDERGQWVITEWIDIKKDDFPTWSELKGRFY